MIFLFIAKNSLFKGVAHIDDTKEQFILKGEAQLRNASLVSKRPKTLLSGKNYQCLSHEIERTLQELHFTGLKSKIHSVLEFESIDNLLLSRSGGVTTPPRRCWSTMCATPLKRYSTDEQISLANYNGNCIQKFSSRKKTQFETAIFQRPLDGFSITIAKNDHTRPVFHFCYSNPKSNDWSERYGFYF